MELEYWTVNQQLYVHRMNLKIENTDTYMTRKEVPELSEAHFSLFECLRQKLGLIFCKHSCIGFPLGPESEM